MSFVRLSVTMISFVPVRKRIFLSAEGDSKSGMRRRMYRLPEASEVSAEPSAPVATKLLFAGVEKSDIASPSKNT